MSVLAANTGVYGLLHVTRAQQVEFTFKSIWPNGNLPSLYCRRRLRADAADQDEGEPGSDVEQGAYPAAADSRAAAAAQGQGGRQETGWQFNRPGPFFRPIFGPFSPY